ncbi:MAG: EamA family transporter [Methylotenera sp.]|uniref:EamA family transporter n=1 Tax=Methylotenera sp. TaxID=2051956 RepID=UPI0027177893|nr:EamA family transporter [Methylotenera sp.]MDO9393349.1 EamA family transporter [Methylotenera sp.]MDP1523331.1 EamA family transporter [Methylotenera sp.]MDP1658362.1 EamA family transporter [Methylotenera sp.]MDP3308838.1 EamA family transporter [Methylotenera sp.]MDP3819474.1 EamA family transporter [Methylotenera sp.]
MAASGVAIPGLWFWLTLYRLLIHAPSVRLYHKELLWFTAAILTGGVIAPVLLMLGLLSMPASGASLLPNMEGVFTALLPWFAFKENFDRRIALGMALHFFYRVGCFSVELAKRGKAFWTMAVFADTGACLIVVFNGLRLLTYKR